ncbi:dsRBD fold-containing protein [Streptomyces sp. NPDC026206]|uniref:dsRBD fold-containing protein n=1 Tax=Streptomyces sp. NPDC026206 TaxID=3157089 RepID=UPI0033E849AF
MSHTAEWKVRLQLVEDGDRTEARVVLDTGTTSLTGTGAARRAPGDEDAPEIGDEFAAGRALRDLGSRLLHTAEQDVEARGAAPDPRTSPVYGWSM